MKQPLRILCVIGLASAFLAMGTAMVLPHSHLHLHGHPADTQAHPCWMCQAKAVGVSTPETGPNLVVLHRVAHLPLPGRPLVPPQPVFFFTRARAPPPFLPAFP